MDFDFGTGTDRNYNLAALGFIVATLFTCIITLLILLFGGGGDDSSRPALPTALVLPTSTETLTPTITRTPLPATFTPTFTATSTTLPTSTATATFTTAPTSSPTPTITTTVLPSATPTITDTPSPTLGTPPPSPSPFLFDLQAPVTYVTNVNNASGCSWQGIGGQVLNVAGDGASSLRVVVRVTGGGLPQPSQTNSNTNTLYGPGGYEIQLANAINTQTYFVQLQSEFGTPLSPEIAVTFPGTCEGNAALVTFQQTRAN